jgi:hypothetical protein
MLTHKGGIIDLACVGKQSSQVEHSRAASACDLLMIICNIIVKKNRNINICYGITSFVF